MKFTDIIALAKQGFTPADIREFMKLDTEQEHPAEDPQQEQEEQPAEDPQQDQEEQPAEDPQQDQEEQPAEDPQQEEPDYKKLYEEEKAKRQAAARKQEVAKDDAKSVEDTLLDIAKMYI